MRTLLQHSCAIDGAPHCLVLRRHSDPHPDVFFLIEMLPHLISANLVAVQLLLPCLRCCCLICTSCLLCRECANPDAEQAVAFVSDLSSRLSLRSVHEAIGFAPNCFVLWRHPDLDCKGLFHRVVYTSNIPTSMPTWLFPFLALLVAVQLHPRWRAVRSLLQHCCTIDGAPHCYIRRRHSDPHPDVVLIEMFPHLIVLNIPMSIQTWLCLRLR